MHRPRLGEGRARTRLAGREATPGLARRNSGDRLRPRDRWRTTTSSSAEAVALRETSAERFGRVRVLCLRALAFRPIVHLGAATGSTRCPRLLQPYSRRTIAAIQTAATLPSHRYVEADVLRGVGPSASRISRPSHRLHSSAGDGLGRWQSSGQAASLHGHPPTFDGSPAAQARGPGEVRGAALALDGALQWDEGERDPELRCSAGAIGDELSFAGPTPASCHTLAPGAIRRRPARDHCAVVGRFRIRGGRVDSWDRHAPGSLPAVQPNLWQPDSAVVPSLPNSHVNGSLKASLPDSLPLAPIGLLPASTICILRSPGMKACQRLPRALGSQRLESSGAAGTWATIQGCARRASIPTLKRPSRNPLPEGGW